MKISNVEVDIGSDTDILLMLPLLTMNNDNTLACTVLLLLANH